MVPWRPGELDQTEFGEVKFWEGCSFNLAFFWSTLKSNRRDCPYYNTKPRQRIIIKKRDYPMQQVFNLELVSSELSGIQTNASNK